MESGKIDFDLSPEVRILVAEDNVINQNVVQFTLEKIGYALDVVSNGAEAVEALGKTAYDLVLMDCQMPVMDGYEATRTVRNAETPVIDHRVPIIALTANNMSGDREKCLDAGMDDYLSKPIDLKQFSQMLEKWLKPKPEAPPTSNARDDEAGETPDFEIASKASGRTRVTTACA